MGKLSAQMAFLLVVAPVPMYLIFLLLGFQMGRLLESQADSSGGVEIMDGCGLRAFQPRGVMSVGPWGGGGQPFYMRGGSAPRLRRIVLYHSGAAIQSLTCYYTVAGDIEWPPPPLRVAGPWGLPHSNVSRGVRTEIIELRSGEHITTVEGTTGHFANVVDVVITSLTFYTSSKTYGPYGSVAAGSSHYFSVPAAHGACIAGFWGRSGWLLDSIGVYMRPSCF